MSSARARLLVFNTLPVFFPWAHARKRPMPTRAHAAGPALVAMIRAPQFPEGHTPLAFADMHRPNNGITPTVRIDGVLHYVTPSSCHPRAYSQAQKEAAFEEATGIAFGTFDAARRGDREAMRGLLIASEETKYGDYAAGHTARVLAHGACMSIALLGVAYTRLTGERLESLLR